MGGAAPDTPCMIYLNLTSSARLVEADERDRTPNFLITGQMFFQLNYIGIVKSRLDSNQHCVDSNTILFRYCSISLPI